jgi:hypothetical protein
MIYECARSEMVKNTPQTAKTTCSARFVALSWQNKGSDVRRGSVKTSLQGKY